jgi:hypothetical protein
MRPEAAIAPADLALADGLDGDLALAHLHRREPGFAGGGLGRVALGGVLAAGAGDEEGAGGEARKRLADCNDGVHARD